MTKKAFFNQQGMTLIETLVVVGVLVIVTALFSNMLFSILKGSAKSQVLMEVKQNGNYTLDVMTRMIRNAKSIEDNSSGDRCTPNMSAIRIINPDDHYTEFACLDLGLPAGRISSGSSTLPAAPVFRPLTSNEVRVFNQCEFDCVPGNPGVNPDKVTIRFSLSQFEPASRPEDEAQVDFKTTVILRNY